ncbi:hypothetical protein QWZ06_16535 [Chryseobacterium tructae]|uniref:Uncharacterized protein n=1 Tax=Chryseobacterium tructae TaxID=1037380 RepID=A0ABV7XZY1_9FLAO|nr:hypothetical protein [Chryseobacterium tructae]MDN3693784.1 hypothetical protein [Chryseobacterium tructae]
MKKRILLILAILCTVILYSQKIDSLQIEKSNHKIAIDNAIIEKDDIIKDVIVKEICFYSKFESTDYTKPSPIEIEIKNYIGLKAKIGVKKYKKMNSAIAEYSITQDGKVFNIRSFKILKIKPNENFKLKALLYKISTNNGYKNLIIIENTIPK